MKFSNIFFKDHYRLLVLGGGTGGCAVAARMQRYIKPSEIAVIEPSEKHYYQPGFTLVGGGLCKFKSVVRNEADVLPRKVDWLISSVAEFNPTENSIQLSDGRSISYDFLVIALGLELRYDEIAGLSDLELAQPAMGICSIYSPRYVENVMKAFEMFSSGDMLFTFPNTPIKCAGAPQKIMYLLEERIRQRGLRSRANVSFCSALTKPFGVEKYADALRSIMRERDISPRYYHNLIGVEPLNMAARFEIFDKNGGVREIRKYQYSLLHIAPPCSPVKVLRETKAVGLTDEAGWVKVNGETLQSVSYPNVFSIGDCSNVPTSKTMAAISSQLKALTTNLKAAIEKKEAKAKYSGYTSCPLVVDSKHVILAEFNGATQTPMETFPYDQSKPSRFAFWLKRYVFPFIYWKLMMKGKWEGPEAYAKLFKRLKIW